MPLLPRVRAVFHADWSKNAAKRRCAVAAWDDARGGYRLGAAQPVGDLDTLPDRLIALAGDSGACLAGFDFAIGLPAAYAARIGCDRFLDLLPELGRGRWSRFFDPAATREEIAPTRPFYPAESNRPGIKLDDLLSAHGVSDKLALLRACDRADESRRQAEALFWLVGGRQVGKGTIVGWRDLLIPALRDRRADVAIWPFDGTLDALLAARRLVIAETYPREFYSHLGFQVEKRKQGDRARVARDYLRPVIKALGAACIDGALARQLADGFGAGGDGEDDFDAVVGLIGMLRVVVGQRAAGDPQAALARRVEGWMLGKRC